MTDGIFRHTPVLTGVKQVRALSIDGALMEHVGELIAQTVRDGEWLEVGDTVEAIVAESYDAVYSWYDNMMVGAIAQFMGAVPDGWLPLDGSTYDEVDYPELYAQLDVVFKNVPAETFTLPDCYDRVIIGSGGALGLGDIGGSASVALSSDEMPSHSHSYIPVVLDVDIKTVGAPTVSAGAPSAPIQTGLTGGGQAHENLPPYVALWFAVYAGRV